MGTRNRFDRIVQTCLIVAFLGLISLPIVGLVFRLDRAGLNEKRRLAQLPPISMAWSSTSRFIVDLRSFLADNFGFRNTLVRWNGHLTMRSLAVSPSPAVVLGKDGWLYYAAEHTIDDYRCIKPFTDAELAEWASVLEHRQKWLEQRGARYLFVVAPNEPTIYPEHLPPYLTRVRDTSRLDQLLAYVKNHTTVKIIDLRPVLFQAKSKERVYQRTDTHWNERGAFAGYTETMNAINAFYPSLKAIPRDRFENTVTMGPSGDLANMMGMADAYQEEVLGLRPLDPRRAQTTTWPLERMKDYPDQPYMVQESEIPGSTLPRLVMLHDSFGLAMIPFLAEHFSRAVYVFKAMGFEETILSQEKPDIVVQEMTERYLWGDFARNYKDRP